ncbi:MAG: polysaccharide deacetylase family protein [Solirubrobacteraceae bacterium]
MSRLAVLGYHKIGPPAPGGWETWFYVSAPVFAEQLATVRDCGWDFIGADALRASVRGDGALPARAALVTFDDGYRSALEHALPVLREHACPAVLFVPTAYVAGTNTFDPDEPVEPICDWPALNALAQAGVAVQSHGVSHRTFSSLTSGERREELARSKAVLEEQVRRPVDLFAFPYGDDADGSGDVGEALREAGYAAAFGYGGDPQQVPVADRFRIQRVAMGPDTDLRSLLGAPA